jgi:hypothetical protein
MAFAQSPPLPATTQTPVTWLIFVDDLHLDFRNTGRIRDLLRTIGAELIREGDRFAIVSSGPSALAVDATTDRGTLAEAIKKVVGNGLKFQDIQSPDGAAEVLYRASTSVATVQSALSNATRALSGTTTLLYVSNGYNVDNLADATQRPSIRGVRIATPAEIHGQMAQLTTTAAQWGIRIFAIAPRATSPLDDPVDPIWAMHHLLERQTSLRSISDPTLGFAIVDGDLVTQLRRLADAMRQ